MDKDMKDLTIINFDNHWKCYQQFTHDDDVDEKTMVSISTEFDTNHHWSSIELPHIIHTNKRENHTGMKSCKWWYWKQFDWTLINKEFQQRIYLKFESFDSLNKKSLSSNIIGTLWLNNEQIYSGSLMGLNEPIELPTTLLRNKNMDKNECDNTLIICCLNGSLSLHTSLIIHGKIIYATGQVQVDENIIVKQNDSEIKESDALDYVVSINDASERINIIFNSKKKYKAPIKPSVPLIQSSEFDRDDILVPRLAIVILIVGTRGDVQPFIALGQALLASGHRVRLATHETFRSFIRGNGLEFYPLAGGPSDLISFMVKNAGIIPSVDSIVSGDVSKKRRSLSDILASTWQACTENDDETNIPFKAEAIIANPPSFGHVHCAEKLQIPLHIMFTMPWSPTTAFAHPLSNIDNSIGSKKIINRYSYNVIEMLTWTGMRDIVNNFRKKILGLTSLNTSQATNALIDERVPHTYCWSPSLVSKPDDWKSHIDVSGFFFLDLGSAYTNPPKDLLNFLDLNNNTLLPPIYIGFGSIAGHDSRRILEVVIDVLNQTGYRAILSGLASDTDHLPDNIFKIDNVPHDWLFQHVSAVCHHGGAGTTAAGLRAGKPTIIVPFFGDQFFWGTVIEKSGAGPHPIPGKSITVDDLVNAFHFVHKTTTRIAAERLRDSILKENGCTRAVDAFHRNLPLTRMHSDLEPTFPACYRSDKYNIQISRPVAQVLVTAGIIEESQLSPHVTQEWQFMYDNHMHLLTHGFIQHSRKAFSNMFIHTASGLKRAASDNNIAMGTLKGAGTVAKGFGLGLGHLTIGYLSLYGEITDVLERLTYLYDPYSNPQSSPRPIVNNFRSGAKTAGLVLWNGWKDGVMGIVRQPYTGYKRHGILGGAAGSLIGTVNICMKPTISTLASVTWLSRGTYAGIKNLLRNYKKEGRHISSKLFHINSSLSTENNVQIENDDNEQITSMAKIAANISGFHPKVCQYIIDEFEKIKIEHEQIMFSSSTKKKTSMSLLFPPNKTKRSSSLNRYHHIQND